MRTRHDAVSVVGLSMGGALAALLAAEQHEIPTLVLIAPYLGMPPLLRAAAATHWLWGRLAGEVNARSPKSIHDPIEREKNLSYGAVTGRELHELWVVVQRARKALSNVRAPTLIIQSREDPRCPPDVAKFALAALGSAEKQLVWTEGAGHIITVDYGRERVFGEVERWLETHGGEGAAAATKKRAAAENP
jgi:carboxylesterase